MSIKGIHSSPFTTCLIDILSTNYLLDSQKNNSQICKQRAVIHIPNIKLKLFSPRYVIPTIHLCPSRNTRSYFMSASLLFAIKRKILYQQRTRTNQSHIPFQDINQLRQFINGCRANKGTYLSQTICIRQQITFSIPLVRHSLKLNHLEYFLILSRPFLKEECSGSFVGKVKPDGNNQQYWPNNRQYAEHENEVNHPLKKIFIHELKNLLPLSKGIKELGR